VLLPRSEFFVSPNSGGQIKALSFDQAHAEIVKMSGTQFDPRAVQAYLAEQTILREMVAAKCMQPHDPAISQAQMKGASHGTQH
jgi:hypothetical protein